MLDVAGTVWALENIPPGSRRPLTKPVLENVPAAPKVPKEIQGIGSIVNSDAKISWKKGISNQGDSFEVYYGAQNPDAR
jgi:hypothetical protein